MAILKRSSKLRYPLMVKTQKLPGQFNVRFLLAKTQNFKLECERIISRKSSYVLGI